MWLRRCGRPGYRSAPISFTVSVSPSCVLTCLCIVINGHCTPFARHLHKLAVHGTGVQCVQLAGRHICLCAVLRPCLPQMLKLCSSLGGADTHLSCDGVSGELEDSMESFFLSETSKYLFLLQANTTHLPDHYIFTTEGHLLPPFTTSPQPPATPTPVSQHAVWRQHLQRACCWLSPDFGKLWTPMTDQSSESLGQSGGMLPSSLSSKASAAAKENCDSLCSSLSAADIRDRQHLLQASLPLLPLSTQDAVILRQAFGF